MNTTKLFVPIVLLLGAQTHAAQQPIKSYDGYLQWGFWDMDFLGDLDKDGFGEILLGEGSNGELIVVSSSTGLELFTFIGSKTTSGLGVRVSALGDTDGDGIGDFGACFSKLDKCIVWSGKTEDILLEVAQPLANITGVGDGNGDALADVLIGQIGVIFVPGSATVHRGGSFTPAYTVYDLSPVGGGFSRSATGVGDVDGDGLADFAVGAPSNASPSECLPGYVEVYSGVDGASLYKIVGETVTDNFGATVVALGDVTGDDVGDLVVGASTADGLPWCKVNGLGRIYFLDGVNGTLLEMLQPEYPKTGLGSALEAVGDLDGNGYPDVLARVVDDLDPNGTEIWAIDGKTRERIYTIPNPYDAFVYGFGSALAGIGDWSGDGFPDFLVASVSTIFMGTEDGRLELYSGAPIGVTVFGTACPNASGSLPRIGATGSPVIGSDYAVHLSQVEPGLDAFLAIGVSSARWRGLSLPLDLAFAGMPGCKLLVSPAKVFAAQTSPVTPGLGAATVEIPIPYQHALVGFTGYAQWFVMNPLGSPTPGATTRGLQITFQAPPP